MIAPLGTLAFLVTLWLLVVLGARIIEENGARIAAALKAKPVQRQAAASVRVRTRARMPRPMRVKPRWSAAA